MTTILMAESADFTIHSKISDTNNTAERYFGYSAGTDGQTIVVGAYGYNNNTGRAYVYEYNATSDTYEEVAELFASDPAENDYFGLSVAVDKDTILVGATGKDSQTHSNEGAVYLFEKPQGGWLTSTETVKLIASDAGDAYSFGVSVAIEGNTSVIGAYGADVGTHDKAGAAYVFERIGSDWLEKAKLTAFDANDSDKLGGCVSISGNTIIAGAPYEDFNATLIDSGAVYVYEKPKSGGWVSTNEANKLIASDHNATDNFGASAAISGNTVVVGAYKDDDNGSNSGSAYVYVHNVGEKWPRFETAKLRASDGAVDDDFGAKVAIDGDTIIVSAHGDDVGYWSKTGSAYVFVKPKNGWEWATEDRKLIAPDAAPYDRFGIGLAYKDNTIVLGSPYDDNGSIDNVGSAYIFTREPANENNMNPGLLMYLLN